MTAREPSSQTNSATTPRRLAFEVICRVLTPNAGAFAQDILQERLSRSPLKAEDRRLAADLVYGVIRRRATLDAVLAAYASRPLNRIDEPILQIGRLGLYQILFQERVPDHAAVDEAVKLANESGMKSAGGFLNGILRSVLRDIAFVERPDPARPRHSFELLPGRACIFGKPVLPSPTDLGAHLAAALSFPIWLVRRWLAEYGTSKAREFLAMANSPPPLFIRVNPLRISMNEFREQLAAEGIEATLSPSGRTLRLPPHSVVEQLPGFDDGLFQVQDDSGSAVVPFLDPQPGESVLDLCAAPGGKTCHCVERMQNSGEIVAVDLSKNRLRRLAENIERMGCTIVKTVEADATDIAIRNRGAFDRVLLDAPCSNTGVLRRRVEARWRLGDKPLAALVKTQSELLRAAVQALKPDGTLVYSTCSMEPEENEKLVARVLRLERGFALDAQERLLPQRDGGDGHFMARIRRAAGGSAS